MTITIWRSKDIYSTGHRCHCY